MRTKITPDNPYRYDRYGFAWQKIPSNTMAHLDFGCNTGSFLSSLRGKGIGRLVGVDISRDAVRRAHKEFPDVEIFHISKTAPLPFNDRTFTSITVLDVLEHVCEQTDLLNELNRVLTEDGTLIVTVPRKHIFSFLDVGNFKFRFPKLHKWYYRRNYTAEEYKYRYVSNPDGLVGDISSVKRWHEHFSRTELTTLLNNCGFVEIFFDGSGLFARTIRMVAYFTRHFDLLQPVMRRVADLDANLFESANLFCVAQKAGAFS